MTFGTSEIRAHRPSPPRCVEGTSEEPTAQLQQSPSRLENRAQRQTDPRCARKMRSCGTSVKPSRISLAICTCTFVICSTRCEKRSFGGKPFICSRISASRISFTTCGPLRTTVCSEMRSWRISFTMYASNMSTICSTRRPEVRSKAEQSTKFSIHEGEQDKLHRSVARRAKPPACSQLLKDRPKPMEPMLSHQSPLRLSVRGSATNDPSKTRSQQSQTRTTCFLTPTPTGWETMLHSRHEPDGHHRSRRSRKYQRLTPGNHQCHVQLQA